MVSSYLWPLYICSELWHSLVIMNELRGRVESPNVPLPYTEILIQLFGPKRVTQLLNYDIIEFPEEGYLLHFKLEFPEGENQLLYSCAY